MGKAFILSASVGANESGETPLQWYNSSLSLAHLDTVVDLTLLFQNGDVSALFTGNSKDDKKHRQHLQQREDRLTARRFASGKAASKEKKKTSVASAFGSVNEYIANCLVDTLNPVETATYSSSRARPPVQERPLDLGEFVGSVAPLPGNKLVEVWSSSGLPPAVGKSGLYPSSQALFAKHVLRRAPGDPSATGGVLACRVTARSGDEQDLSAFRRYFTSGRTQSRLQSVFPLSSCAIDSYTLLCTALPPRAICHDILKSSTHPAGSPPRSVSVCLNRSRVNVYLRRVLEQTAKMYQMGAYVHWYNRAGVSKADLEHSLMSLRDTIDNYSYMTQ
jgi:hypothetical protein